MTSETQDASASKFDRRPKAARKWWRHLNGLGEDDAPGDGEDTAGADEKKKLPKDRAALARLRRASPQDAMCEEATLRLFHALGFKSDKRLPRVATLAAVLATIRVDDASRSFGRQIGRKPSEIYKEDKTAALKLGRFKHLLDAQTEDEIATSFRRAIAILGRTANVRDVARYVLFFDDERDDGRTRRQLVFDYYGAGEREADPPDANAASKASAT